MQKRIYSLVFCFYWVLMGNAQNTVSFSFDIMGDIGFDRGFTIASVNDGIFLVSTSPCLIGGCPGVIKTDFDGIENWRVVFDFLPFEIDAPFSNPVVKPNGHYVIGGGCSPFGDIFNQKGYLLEFDSLGVIYWMELYGGNFPTYLYQIEALEDDGYLLYGEQDIGGGFRRYFAKVDSLGNLEWEETMPLVEDSWDNRVREMEILEDGKILHYVETNLTNAGWGKALVLLDEDLNPLMTKHFVEGEGDQIYINDVPNIGRKRKDGGYVIPYTVDTITPGPGVGISAMAMVGLDSFFNIEWVTPFPTYGWKGVLNFIIAENGDIIGCGRDSQFPITPDDNANAGWLFRMSPDGELLWERDYYEPEHWEWNGFFDLVDVVELPDGRIAGTGRRLDRLADGTLDGNVWLLIVDENGCLTSGCTDQYIFVDIEEPESGSISKAEAVFFRLSPNPSSSKSRLEFFNPLPYRSLVQLISATGQIISQKILTPGIRNHEFEVANLSKGAYWIMLEMQGSVVQREKLIVH